MRYLNRAVEIFFIGCLAAIVVVVFGQVVVRYCLRDVPPWTEEVARTIFTWIIFVGTAVAYRHKSHIVIDLILNHLPGTLHRVLTFVILGGMTVFLGFVLVEGVMNLWLARADVSPVLEVSMAVFYLPLPVGIALTLLYVLLDLWGEVSGKRI
jgi:TRAP-type transport system small permease protein